MEGTSNCKLHQHIKRFNNLNNHVNANTTNDYILLRVNGHTIAVILCNVQICNTESHLDIKRCLNIQNTFKSGCRMKRSKLYLCSKRCQSSKLQANNKYHISFRSVSQSQKRTILLSTVHVHVLRCLNILSVKMFYFQF